MKNDPMFKFLAATVLIGAIIALVSPGHAVNDTASTETVHATATSE
jgi:hypothetical protein